MKHLMHFDIFEDAMGAPRGPQRRARNVDFEDWKEDLEAAAEVEPGNRVGFGNFVDCGGAMGLPRGP